MAREEHPETTKMRRRLRWRVGVPMYAAATAVAYILEPLTSVQQAAAAVLAVLVGVCVAVLVLGPELLERTIRETNGEHEATSVSSATERDPWYQRLNTWIGDYTPTINAVGMVVIPIAFFMLLRLLGD